MSDRSNAADAKLKRRVTQLLGAISGVGIGVVFTGMGVLGLESLTYGAISGLFGGIGAFLFLPWWVRLSDVQNAEDDYIPLGEVIDRAGGVSHLSTFGIGIGVGGAAMIVVGLSLGEPNFGLGLGAAATTTIITSAVATVLFRWIHRRARRSRPDRDHRRPREVHTRRENVNERSASDDETNHWTSRLRPDTLGEAFGLLFAVSFGSFYLSLLGVAVFGLVSGELAILPLIVAAGSWVGVVVSLFGYGSWSAWQLRGLPRDPDRPTPWNPLKMLAYVIAVFIGNNDDLDAYDRRLRWTLWAFLLGVFVLLIPVEIVHGGPPGSG